ncbi:MAG: UDP-N-acetylmuramate dehydrogenase [Candidatus Omnitrophota bacterium]
MAILLMSWQEGLKRVTKGKISFGEPLKSRCTFKIGGTAKVWVEPKDKEDLKIILRFFTKIGMPVFVIGGGSNILFNDGLIEGIIIHLGSCYFRRIIFKGDLVKAGSGVSLAKLIQKAKEENLGGCEHLFGIPGTVGGALSMNAGISLNSCQLDIGSLVSEVEVMDYNGNIHILEKEDLKFDYRSSNLNRFVIVSATLRLKKSSPLEITSEISRIKDMRAASHGYPKASAGCIFKNPKRGLSAGFLIERCGLKGARVGDAQISSSHANFILNVGNARASNVINLMALTRRLVKKRFNLDLEQEVRIVG